MFKLWSLFDSITIEYGTLNSLCAEGAPLPSWDAGAEIQDRVTTNCRPDSGRSQPRTKEMHTLLSAHRIGSLQTNGQEPKRAVSVRITKYGRTITCTCGCQLRQLGGAGRRLRLRRAILRRTSSPRECHRQQQVVERLA